MAHLVESRCKWVVKVMCKKKWPNCLVSKEKPCIRERQPLLIEDSTLVMKRIATIFWVLLWARHSTHAILNPQALWKLDIQRGKWGAVWFNHVFQVTGLGSREAGFCSQVVPALLTNNLHKRKKECGGQGRNRSHLWSLSINRQHAARKEEPMCGKDTGLKCWGDAAGNEIGSRERFLL